MSSLETSFYDYVQAERTGFEPAEGVTLHRFSKPEEPSACIGKNGSFLRSLPSACHDDRLARVIEAWPSLGSAIRERIVTLATEGQDDA
jgi:hypothetical protein